MNKEILFSSKDDMWATRLEYFQPWNSVYQFTLDPCATEETAKCNKFFTKEQDGLKQSWKGETVYCNPPYGNEVEDWIIKSINEVSQKNTKVVMLLPARTDTQWFHEYLYRNKEINIIFIKGRLTFGTDKYWKENYWDVEFINGKKNKLFGKVGKYYPAPFPSMLVEFGLNKRNFLTKWY